MSGRHLSHSLRQARSATAVLTATVLAVAACGESEKAAEPTPVATTAAVTTLPPTTVASPKATASKFAAQAPPKAATIKVPRGVGLDYQSAQDLWRGAGLHVAPAEDATGAHRLPVIDANWIVVSQDPEAGSKVAAGSFITATVKKNSDD